MRFVKSGFLGAALLLSASVSATPLFTSPFEAPTYSDAALIGQDNWVIVGTSTTNALQVTNTATNGVVGLASTGQDASHTLTGAVTSASVYLGADINLSAAGTGDYFLHFSDVAGNTSPFSGRISAKTSGTGYVLGFGTGTITYGTTVLPFNTTQRVIGRYDFVTGGTTNDTGALFVSPTDTTSEAANTPYLATTALGGTDATSIKGVNLRQGSTGSSPTLTVDNLQVATTFSEAATVPEPASLSLVGVAAVLLSSRRRSTAK